MSIIICCPNCNEKLIIQIQDNKIISIETDNRIISCKNEIFKILKKHNIEFG